MTASRPILYHAGLSSCSQRVRMYFAERGREYESRIVDLRGFENLQPAYLAINPKGLVPVLVDDGQVVTESIDILRHLDGDDAMGGGDDPLTAAADAAQTPLKDLTHEYMFRARGAPDPATLPPHADPEAARYRQEFFEDGSAWQARVVASTTAMARQLEHVAARLEYGPWLGGSALSLVDLAWMSTVHRLRHLGWALPAKVGGWYARIAARDSFKVAVLDHEPPGMAAAQTAYVARRRAAGTAIDSAGV